MSLNLMYGPGSVALHKKLSRKAPGRRFSKSVFFSVVGDSSSKFSYSFNRNSNSAIPMATFLKLLTGLKCTVLISFHICSSFMDLPWSMYRIIRRRACIPCRSSAPLTMISASAAPQLLRNHQIWLFKDSINSGLKDAISLRVASVMTSPSNFPAQASRPLAAGHLDMQ